MNTQIKWGVRILVMTLGFSHAGLADEIDRVIAGVVKIISSVDGERKTGTGFVVRRDADLTYVVTASHVVEGDNRPELEFFDKQNEPVKAEVRRIEGDNPRGLALLVARNLPASVPALELAATVELKRGDEVMAIGFPQGGDQWAVVRAFVSARDGIEWTLSGPIDEGNSGGPVLRDGQVVGIVTRMQNNFGRASPAQIIKLSLEGWGVKPRLAGVPSVTAVPGAPSAPQSDRPRTAAASGKLTLRARGAEPQFYRGPCPAQVQFGWDLSGAGSGGEVAYRLVLSDGVFAPTKKVWLAAHETIEVRETWTLASNVRSYSGWAAINILEPQRQESPKIAFQVACEPGSANRAAPPAKPEPAAPSIRAVDPKLAAPATVNSPGVGYPDLGDLRSMIKLRAERSKEPVDKLPDGRIRHLYSVWIEVPADVTIQIDRVLYHYDHAAFENPRTQQSNSKNGFRDSYIGIGAVNADMDIIVVLKDGTEVPFKFNMWKAIFGK